MSIVTKSDWEQQQAGAVQRAAGKIRHMGMLMDIRTSRIAIGQTSVNDDPGRKYQEDHVVKKVLLIVALLLVIGQLVWMMGK